MVKKHSQNLRAEKRVIADEASGGEEGAIGGNGRLFNSSGISSINRRRTIC